ncbi:hypothetical protein [Rathayibacter sp. AY1G1]|uniref:hypothetical protein n=1 Tax=Rathayibacter sp. AY1G1 TaxID=2080564 RepID=UPI0011B078D8|nr:hypothetical protein [Rathayibacter sp. AY1G1]
MTSGSRHRIRVAAALTTGAALLTAAGCAPAVQTSGCPGWAYFGSAEARYEVAEAVITTASTRASGTQSVFSVAASAYMVTVDETEKGPFIAGETIRVVSMPDACSGTDLYPDGDPMDTDQPLRLYLRSGNGFWATLTPLEGAEPIEE